jgi:hypothetical protein
MLKFWLVCFCFIGDCQKWIFYEKCVKNWVVSCLPYNFQFWEPLNSYKKSELKNQNQIFKFSTTPLIHSFHQKLIFLNFSSNYSTFKFSYFCSLDCIYLNKKQTFIFFFFFLPISNIYISDCFFCFMKYIYIYIFLSI